MLLQEVVKDYGNEDVIADSIGEIYPPIKIIRLGKVFALDLEVAVDSKVALSVSVNSINEMDN